MKQTKLLKILLIMLGVVMVIGAGGLFYKSKTTPPSPLDVTPIPRQNIEVEGTVRTVPKYSDGTIETIVLETENTVVYELETDNAEYKLAESFFTIPDLRKTNLTVRDYVANAKGYIYKQQYVDAYKKFIPVLYVESMEILQAPEGFKLVPSPTPEI